MRLVIIGCEYSGTTTLGFRIRDWVHEELGGWVKNVHDHGKFPYTVTHEQEYTPVPSDFTVEEQEQALGLEYAHQRDDHAAQRGVPRIGDGDDDGDEGLSDDRPSHRGGDLWGTVLGIRGAAGLHEQYGRQDPQRGHGCGALPRDREAGGDP